MHPESTVFPTTPAWEGDGTHRIPFLAYTSPEIYRRELERFLYRGHWCYVGLEAEVPNPG
ncbi:MAG: salicylate hydroxylase, partial [Rubrivivax sp.]